MVLETKNAGIGPVLSLDLIKDTYPFALVKGTISLKILIFSNRITLSASLKKKKIYRISRFIQ